MIQRYLLVVGTVALAGCVSAPSSPDRAGLGMAPAAAWQTAGVDGAALDGWLADFESPELEALVAEAMLANPDLQQAAARVEAARAQLAISHSARLPTLAADGGASRSRRPQTLSSGKVDGAYSNSVDVGLGLSWEWDLWGRLALADSAALASYEAQHETYRAARLSLAAQVTSAWLTATRDRLQWELAQSTLASYESTQTIIERRYAAAQTSALDVRLGRATVAQARGDVAAAERTRRESIRAIEILLGRYPSGELTLPGDLPTLRQPAVPAGLPADLLLRRPDLAAAERRLAAAEADLAAERKNRLPTIGLSASGGTASNELRHLLDPDYIVATLALNLAAPLLDGGRREALQEVADAERAGAQAAYLSAALAAFGDVENALANGEQLSTELASYQTAWEQYSAAETLARDQYAQGLVDVTTLLDAQRRTVDAHSRLIDARNRLLLNRLQLYSALGGDFVSRPATAPTDRAGSQPTDLP